MNPGMVLTKVRFLCRDLNMKVIVTRHFLHPETGQHCAIGEEVELSYIHFLHMEGLGAAKMPAIIFSASQGTNNTAAIAAI